MTKRKNSSTNIDFDNALALANFIFEQNKMQQESKDTWFGHYMSIIAGVAALATVCLTVFENETNKLPLYFAIGVAIFLTGCLGILFFWIFLCQRRNYWKNYKMLNEIQIMLIESTLKKDYHYYYPKYDPFAKRRHGADFFAAIVENVLVSICFAIGLLFVMLSFNISTKYIVIATCSTFLISFLILLHIFKKFEKQNKLN